MLQQVQVGDTRKYTWIDSSTAPSAVTLKIYNGSEAVVASLAMTGSGGGHFFGLAVVNSPGFHVAEFNATINGDPYIRRMKFKAVLIEVD